MLSAFNQNFSTNMHYFGNSLTKIRLMRNINFQQHCWQWSHNWPGDDKWGCLWIPYLTCHFTPGYRGCLRPSSEDNRDQHVLAICQSRCAPNPALVITMASPRSFCISCYLPETVYPEFPWSFTNAQASRFQFCWFGRTWAPPTFRSMNDSDMYD